MIKFLKRKQYENLVAGSFIALSFLLIVVLTMTEAIQYNNEANMSFVGVLLISSLLKYGSEVFAQIFKILGNKIIRFAIKTRNNLYRINKGKGKLPPPNSNFPFTVIPNKGFFISIY
jgi:hypothetical protein